MFPEVLIENMKPKELMDLIQSQRGRGTSTRSSNAIRALARPNLVRENVALIRRLGAAYRLGLVANSDGTAEKRLHEFGLGRFFDCVIDSEIVGIRKPEAGIYQLAAARLGCQPQECVFVDDRAENVQGARAIGMSAVLFSRRADAGLDRQLKRLGVDTGTVQSETPVRLVS